MLVLETIEAFIQARGLDRRYRLALSGGLDSTVLLHAFMQCKRKYPSLRIDAIHIDHGLQAVSKQWARHCETFCHTLQIPIEIIALHLSPSKGESVEAYAREQRYAAFAALLQTNDDLVTAHHQNDQAETVLLQLCRGAGVKGLSAMPRVRELGLGFIVRPLLSVAHKALIEYATTYPLEWVHDISNEDRRFSRNLIRHEVLPMMEKTWPAICATLSRVAEHCQEASVLMDRLAEEDLKKIADDSRARERSGINVPFAESLLNISALKMLDSVRQKNVLRFWLTKQGFLLPSTTVLTHILTDVVYAREDAVPCIAWENAEVRRFRDALYVMRPLTALDSTLQIPWDAQGRLLLPCDLGYLKGTVVIGEGIKILPQFSVRFRTGGEVCYLPGRVGGHRLKHLWQEWGVPTWERDRTALLYHEEKLVAVVGYCVCAEYVTGPNEKGLVITHEPFIDRKDLH